MKTHATSQFSRFERLAPADYGSRFKSTIHRRERRSYLREFRFIRQISVRYRSRQSRGLTFIIPAEAI